MCREGKGEGHGEGHRQCVYGEEEGERVWGEEGRAVCIVDGEGECGR